MNNKEGFTYQNDDCAHAISSQLIEVFSQVAKVFRVDREDASLVHVIDVGVHHVLQRSTRLHAS